MNNLILLIFTGVLVGAASGYLGSFMVIKRMALVGDALSHVALPGMAIAIVFGINPMLGAFLALSIAVWGIWYLGERTDIYSEALVGVFFTASLAIGILVTPEPELLEALFGNLESINLFDAIMTIIGSLVIYFVIKKISEKIILGVVSEDLAKSTGVKISNVNFAYLLMVGLVVALGVKFVGTLLTGALVIVPATAAKNLSRSVKQFQLLSAVFGAVSASLGIIVSHLTNVSAGPVVVLISVFIFIISYFAKSD